MSKSALRHLVRELQNYFPINAGTRAAKIHGTQGNKYERQVVSPPIRLSGGVTVFASSKSRGSGSTAYMFDPTPDAPGPHLVYYTLGHYHMLEIDKAWAVPTDEYELIPCEKEILKMKVLLGREPRVHSLLAKAQPHSLKVDVYDVATRSGLSTSTVRSWIENGSVSWATRERLAAVLGVKPEDIP